MKTIYREYTIIYFFNDSRMGFSNSITVCSVNEEEATKTAINAISSYYGSKMLKRFSFNQPVLKQ